jgi:hypothetical protein
MIHRVPGERAPLQRRLGELAKGLAAAAFLLVALIFLDWFGARVSSCS